MIWALVAISIVLVIVSSASTILCALIVSRSVQDANRHVSSMHERWVRQQDRLLDRLMTIRWESFAALESYSEGEDGGWTPPAAEDGEDGPDQVVADVFGGLRSLIDDTHPNEQELIDEDLALDEQEKVET